MKRKSTSNKPVTTTQKLGSVIKSARDIMRTDKGLNRELGRFPQLTWIMFLKLLDDSEKLHEVKEDLLKDFNLHTIVRLPNGVFAPHTSIPTNLLFFDRSGQTSEFLPDLDLTLLASLLLSGEKPKDLISKFRENIRRGNS